MALNPRIRIRIETLSDLVFGLALSIGSLVLIGKAPQSGLDLAIDILLFGFGFFVIVMIWLGYSRTMAVLPGEVPAAFTSIWPSCSAWPWLRTCSTYCSPPPPTMY
jgi:hypothetical protein